MFRLRGCPKCGGDQWYDSMEKELACLQCGHREKYEDKVSGRSSNTK